MDSSNRISPVAHDALVEIGLDALTDDQELSDGGGVLERLSSTPNRSPGINRVSDAAGDSPTVHQARGNMKHPLVHDILIETTDVSTDAVEDSVSSREVQTDMHLTGNLNKAKAVGLFAVNYANVKRKRRKKFERRRSNSRSVSSAEADFRSSKLGQESDDSADDIYGSLISMVTLSKSNKPDRKLSIHECIRKKSIRHVKKCLKEDTSTVSRTNKQGILPLHVAAQCGYTNMVELLIEKGADVNSAAKQDGVTPLHVCAKFNRMEVARVLISHGAKLDAKGAKGETPLHAACRYGHSQLVKLLLDSGAKLISTNEDHQTALHYATINGSAEVVALLIRRGANVLAKDCNRNTPLIFACASGHPKLADMLIVNAAERGFPVTDYLNRQNNRGETALHAATTKRHEQIVQILLQSGCDVTLVKVNGQSALHIAAMNGSTSIARGLIRHGALLTLADSDNMSPLHRAALYNQVDTMKLLLKKGCPSDICDEDSYTPLMCAAWKGNCEAGNLLLDEGALMETTDSDMKNCLHLAVEMDHLPFVKMLISNVATKGVVNATSKYDWSALHFAAENGNTEILQCLLEAGGSLTDQDLQQRTPLHVAASNGKLGFVEAVIREQPDLINETDKGGMTPLLLASKHGHHHVVRYLLKTGADISSRNYCEMTALSLAAMKGNVYVILVLLQFNVNVNAQDKDWNTPLHICCIYDQTDAANLLLNANANFCILNRKRQSVLELAAICRRETIASAILNSKNWEKAMSMRNSIGNTPMDMLIQNIPSCAETVMDKCIRHSHPDQSHADYTITYDFKYIDPGPEDISASKGNKRYFALETMIGCHRENLIRHELVQTVLSLKWNAFGRKSTVLAMVAYGIFVFVYGFFIKAITDEELPKASFGDNGCPAFNLSQKGLETITLKSDGRYMYTELSVWILQCYMLAYIIAEVILICYGLYKEKLNFAMDISNWNEVITFTTTLMFITPLGTVPCAFQWNCGVVGMLTATLRLITLLQRFENIGIYVTMFWTTVRSLLKAMSVYVFFIGAFSFTFRITFGNQFSYETEPMSFLTTFAMTLGEFGRENTFKAISEDEQSIFQASSYILFLVFLFVMPLVLVNLMIGISISDIEAIRASSDLKRIAMKVHVTYSLEDRLPLFLQLKLHKSRHLVYPNRPRKRGIFSKIFHCMFGDSSSGFVRDLVEGDNSVNDSIQNIKGCVDTQKDFQSVMLVVLQQHGDLLQKLAENNKIYTDNLDNVNFLVKGHSDMVESRTSTQR